MVNQTCQTTRLESMVQDVLLCMRERFKVAPNAPAASPTQVTSDSARMLWGYTVWRWRCGGMCGVAAVRLSALSAWAIGPDMAMCCWSPTVRSKSLGRRGGIAFRSRMRLQQVGAQGVLSYSLGCRWYSQTLYRPCLSIGMHVHTHCCSPMGLDRMQHERAMGLSPGITSVICAHLQVVNGGVRQSLPATSFPTPLVIHMGKRGAHRGEGPETRRDAAKPCQLARRMRPWGGGRHRATEVGSLRPRRATARPPQPQPTRPRLWSPQRARPQRPQRTRPQRPRRTRPKRRRWTRPKRRLMRSQGGWGAAESCALGVAWVAGLWQRLGPESPGGGGAQKPGTGVGLAELGGVRRYGEPDPARDHGTDSRGPPSSVRPNRPMSWSTPPRLRARFLCSSRTQAAHESLLLCVL